MNMWGPERMEVPPPVPVTLEWRFVQ
jgi:hypothetical protein